MEIMKVAALQFALPDARPGERGRAAWTAEIERRVAAAVAEGATFVVLPAGAGAGPEGAPAIAAWARVATSPRRPARASPAPDAWVAYCALGTALARGHGIHLVPGSVVVEREGGWAHAAGLFAPDGELIGVQSQGHWPAAALRAGWRASDSLGLLDLAGWPTALLLGHDATRPEGHRLAERAGARLAVALTAWQVPFNPWRQVATVWSAVQQTQVPCVEACLVGPVRGYVFAGHSAVYGPCEATPGETGWYAQAADAMGEAVVVGSLKREVLDRVRERYPIADHLNPALYRRHFAQAYPGYATAPEAPAGAGSHR